MPERAVIPAPEAFVGLYGKLPAHGDFVRRGLPADASGKLQAWLQAELAKLDEALREADAWVWRFACSPGLIASRAVAGVMAASRDKVGRRYPCLALASLPDDDPLLAAECGGWAAKVEDLLRDAAEGGLDANELAGALEVLGGPSAPLDSPTTVRAVEGGAWVEIDSDRALFPALADAAGKSAAADAAFSLWWRADARRAMLLRVEGLPVDGAFSSLFASSSGQEPGLVRVTTAADKPGNRLE